MINHLSSDITVKPILIQIAKDGNWEQTWNIGLTDQQPTVEEIQNYVRKELFKSVAIEFLFPKTPDEVYILGLEYHPNLIVRSEAEFLIQAIEAGYQYRDLLSFISELDKRLVGEAFLFQGEPDIIRIGVVNHWFSVGPCLIWQQGEPKEMSETLLRSRLEKNPKVIETDLNYQGMSFIFHVDRNSDDMCHWIKSPCSRKKGNMWTLDDQMIFIYLNSWLDFRI